MKIEDILKSKELTMAQKYLVQELYKSSVDGFYYDKNKFKESRKRVIELLLELQLMGLVEKRENNRYYLNESCKMIAVVTDKDSGTIPLKFYKTLANKVVFEKVKLKGNNCFLPKWNVSGRGIKFGEIAGCDRYGKLQIPVKVGQVTKKIYAHRLAFFMNHGQLPVLVLPIDGNYLDCSKDNLNGYEAKSKHRYIFRDVLSKVWVVINRGEVQQRVYQTEEEAIASLKELNILPTLRKKDDDL